MEEQISTTEKSTTPQTSEPQQDLSSSQEKVDNSTKNWRSSLPEDYRNKYTEFDTPEDLFKGYNSLVKKLGKNPLVVPPEDASEEEKQKYNMELRKLNGVPEDIKGYSYEVSEELPDEIKALVSEDRISTYKEKALEMGVTPKAFNAMMELYQQQMVNDLQSYKSKAESSYDEAIQSLKKDWGDEFDNKTAAAKKLLEEHVPETERDTITEKYGNDPVIIKAFANLAAKSGEKFQNIQADSSEGQTYESLRDRAKTLTAKSNNAKLSLVERKEASREAYKLNQKAETLKKGSR